jgi:hypothetical protein
VLVGAWLKRVVEGYFRYHAVPRNLAVLGRFRLQGGTVDVGDNEARVLSRFRGSKNVGGVVNGIGGPLRFTSRNGLGVGTCTTCCCQLSPVSQHSAAC